jgi:signal transduction histidine kinase
VAEERLRIARELHDVVAHHIAVITVQSGVASHLLDSQPAAAREALGHVRRSSQVVLAEMATIVGLLRESDGAEPREPAPRFAQVGGLVESMRGAGMTVSLRFTGAPRDLAPVVDLTAYRLVQEALTNAAKYGIGTAEVSIVYLSTSVSLTVSNPVSDVAARVGDREGHGIVGMRERVVAAGGHLDIDRTSGGHFVVRAELPVDVADLVTPGRSAS